MLAYVLCACALLCLSAGPARGSLAFADEISSAEAKALLNDAESQMEVIAAEYQSLQDQIDELQAEIDESAASALEAQEALLEGRDDLSQSMRFEYRSENEGSYLGLLLDSENFFDFLRNIDYLIQIMNHQADEVQLQKQRQAEFQEISEKLNAQKVEQERKLAELGDKKAAAEQIVADAQAQLERSQDAEEKKRLEALASQAAGLQRSPQAEGQIADNSNTTDRQEAVSGDTPVVPDPKPDEGTDDGGGWQSGVASAYGGSSDPYTPNPGVTATGDVCDDWSMGVAVPMAWPNYRSLLGKTVEIRYNGMTVYATVNDCGGMMNGARSLDLQPGVFKAFGFDTCNAWGLRTVQFRFL